MKLIAALLAGAALVATPLVAHAEEVTPRYPPSSVRLKLISGGLVVAGGAYGVGLLCSSTWPEVPGSDALKIPVVGPWLALGQSGCAADDPDCGAKVVVRGILYTIGGLAQLGGLGLISEGIFMKTESSKPAKQAPVLGWQRGGVTFQPTPLISARITGLGIVGSF